MNPADFHISKKSLRKIVLEYRQKLSEKHFHERNSSLCRQIIKLIRENQPEVIHTFLPIERNREPDMTPLFDELRKSGCQIMVSKTNFQNRSLDHFYLNEDTILVKNRLGIPEPEAAERAAISAVKMILVPLATADKSYNRIGYGGGFYDRLLADSKALKVGLSLSPLMDEIVQTDEWDMKMDLVITPFN